MRKYKKRNERKEKKNILKVKVEGELNKKKKKRIGNKGRK